MAPVDAEATYTIATLPKPFDADHGSIRAAPVHGLRGSRKRKRHEVVVGIDGESLSIYSLQSQTLVSSYALPPQTYLCCPPASTYCRQTKQVGHQRRTYAVVRDGFEARKQKLVCFAETNEVLKEPNSRIQPPAKSELKLEDGDVVGIDVLPSASSESFDSPSCVLVTYRDGRTNCISPDLSGTAWTSESEFEPENARVMFATTFPVEDALKGLLANREDVAATLSSSSANTAIRQLLLRLVLINGDLKLALFSLRLPGPDGIQIQRSCLTKIMEYGVPLAKKPKKESEYDFHAASGKLYQLSGGRLTIYDLSATVPGIQRKFGSGTEPVTSFARISSSSVLAVTGTHTLVYETRYGSVQQTIPLTLAQAPSTPRSKRKSWDTVLPSLPVSAIVYFGDLGSLVMLADTELLVAPINDASKSSKKAKFSHTSLSDVIGSAERTAPPKLSQQSRKEKLETWQKEFDASIARGDLAKVEGLAAKALRLKHFVHDDAEQDPTDLASDLDTLSFDIENIDRRRVLYILGKCFKSGNDQDIAKGIRLLVAASTTDLFKWLALTGFLTTASIRQALLQNNPSSRPAVVPGDVMVAMSRHDETFTLLFEMLALPVHWDVEEVVSALRLLAQSFETDDPLSQDVLSASVAPDEDTPMINGDTAHNFESETLAAEKEFDHAMTTLDTGLQVRSDAFRLTLQRLHTFPSSAITTAMRSFMTQRQLIFFIHIMRIELSDGGWITRYTDAFVDEENPASDETPENRAIKAIADVLNCAVDAIGTSGWLVGLSGNGTNAEELVSALRAEINACLEGSYEASNLETMIDELERYRQIAKESGTLFKESRQDDLNGDEAVLPIGLRIEAPILDPKDGKKLHIKAKEKNQRVGLYTFERIRF